MKSELTQVNQVVKPVEGAVIQSEDLTLQDYHMLGDVAWVRIAPMFSFTFTNDRSAHASRCRHG